MAYRANGVASFAGIERTRLELSRRPALADDVNTDEEGRLVIARIATFVGGDAEEMRRRNNEILVERATELPAGILRVMVLMKDESRWSVISFFDSEEAAAAAEERFEQMGDEIPESVRGKRVSLESFEVAFDVEMVR
jgi:hypothetical protein